MGPLTARRALFACAALALSATGCFIDPNKLGDGGADGGGDGGTSNDMSVTPTDGASLDTGSMVIEKSGAVVVAQFQSTPTSGTATTPMYVASAGFYDTVNTPCALTTVGACQVQKCANGAPTPNNSAGVVTITGSSVGTTTLSPNGKVYTPIMANTLYWSTAQTLTVTAAGADVPAFTGNISAPALINVTNPPPPNADMLGPPTPFSKSSDLTFSWTGGVAPADVELTLSSLPADYLVRCKFPAASGTGAVPASVMTQLFNDGVTTVRLTATSIGATNLMAGAFKVGLLAINTASYSATIDIE